MVVYSYIFKVNRYTFRENNSLTLLHSGRPKLYAILACLSAIGLIFISASRPIRGQGAKSSHKNTPCFKRAALYRKANRKSLKLFPFVKMIEIHGGVQIHLNEPLQPML